MFIDFSYARARLKRSAKAVRNLALDPVPRNGKLELKGATLTGTTLTLNYKAMNETYTVTVTLPEEFETPLTELPKAACDQVFACIGIAFCPFFFKLSDFAEVIVHTASLDDDSIAFFERFLIGGLAEFRYLHGLDPRRRVAVTALGKSMIEPITYAAVDRLLMLNGGGKDTIVAGELLKSANQVFTWVSIRPDEPQHRVVELSGLPDAIDVSYVIDRRVNENKVYNWGHMPHTSVVLAIGLLVALVTKSRYLAVGNERSANFGNVAYRGFEVNHQYTKSYEYEKGFYDFAKRCVATPVDVFSLLRPYGDLQLAVFFAQHKKYFKHFISCNRGISKGKGEWCKECAKCAFTALALYPFVDQQSIEEIFGEDIILRAEIRKYVLKLVSAIIKPWECVGTRDECVLALKLLLVKRPDLEFPEFPRRADLERVVKGQNVEKLYDEVLRRIGFEHLIPDSLIAKLNAGLTRDGMDEFQLTERGNVAEGELGLAAVV